MLDSPRGGTPMEYQREKFVLRSTNHAAMLFYGGLITLPLVTSVYTKGINDMRGQAHTIETRLRLGVTQTAQSHRPSWQ